MLSYVYTIELVDIECVLGDVSGVQILLLEIRHLGFCVHCFYNKNPGAS